MPPSSRRTTAFLACLLWAPASARAENPAPLAQDIQVFMGEVAAGLDRPGRADLPALALRYQDLEKRVETEKKTCPPCEGALKEAGAALEKLGKDAQLARFPLSRQYRDTVRPEGAPAEGEKPVMTILEEAAEAWTRARGAVPEAGPDAAAEDTGPFRDLTARLAELEGKDGPGRFAALRGPLLDELAKSALAAAKEAGGAPEGGFAATDAWLRVELEAQLKAAGLGTPKTPEEAEALAKTMRARRPALARYFAQRGLYRTFLDKAFASGAVAPLTLFQPWELGLGAGAESQIRATRLSHGGADYDGLEYRYPNGKRYFEGRSGDKTITSLTESNGSTSVSVTLWEGPEKPATTEAVSTDAQGRKTVEVKNDHKAGRITTSIYGEDERVVQTEEVDLKEKTGRITNHGPDAPWASAEGPLDENNRVRIKTLLTHDGVTVEKEGSLVSKVTDAKGLSVWRTDLSRVFAGMEFGEKWPDWAPFLELGRQVAGVLGRGDEGEAADAFAGWLYDGLYSLPAGALAPWKTGKPRAEGEPDPEPPAQLVITPDGTMFLVVTGEDGAEMVHAAAYGSAHKFGKRWTTEDAVLAQEPFPKGKSPKRNTVVLEYLHKQLRQVWSNGTDRWVVKNQMFGVSYWPDQVMERDYTKVKRYTRFDAPRDWKEVAEDETYSNEHVADASDFFKVTGKVISDSFAGPALEWGEGAGKDAFHFLTAGGGNILGAFGADVHLGNTANAAVFMVPPVKEGMSAEEIKDREEKRNGVLMNLRRNEASLQAVEAQAVARRLETLDAQEKQGRLAPGARAAELARAFDDEELYQALRDFSSGEFGDALIKAGQKTDGAAAVALTSLGVAAKFTTNVSEGLLNPVMLAAMGAGPVGRFAAPFLRTFQAGRAAIAVGGVAMRFTHVAMGGMMAYGAAGNLDRAISASKDGDWAAFWSSGADLGTDLFFAATMVRGPKKGKGGAEKIPGKEVSKAEPFEVGGELPKDALAPELMDVLKILKANNATVGQKLDWHKGGAKPENAPIPPTPEQLKILQRPGGRTHMRVYEFARKGDFVEIKVTDTPIRPGRGSRTERFVKVVAADKSPIKLAEGENLRHVLAVEKPGLGRGAFSGLRDRIADATRRISESFRDKSRAGSRAALDRPVRLPRPPRLGQDEPVSPILPSRENLPDLALRKDSPALPGGNAAVEEPGGDEGTAAGSSESRVSDPEAAPDKKPDETASGGLFPSGSGKEKDDAEEDGKSTGSGTGGTGLSGGQGSGAGGGDGGGGGGGTTALAGNHSPPGPGASGETLPAADPLASSGTPVKDEQRKNASSRPFDNSRSLGSNDAPERLDGRGGRSERGPRRGEEPPGPLLLAQRGGDFAGNFGPLSLRSFEAVSRSGRDKPSRRRPAHQALAGDSRAQPSETDAVAYTGRPLLAAPVALRYQPLGPKEPPEGDWKDAASLTVRVSAAGAVIYLLNWGIPALLRRRRDAPAPDDFV